MEQLIKLIGGTDLPDEVKEKLIEAANSEKNNYDNRYSNKDSEALKLKKALQSIGYDKEKFSSYQEFVESMTNQQQEFQQKDLSLQELTSELSGVKNQLSQIQQEKEEASKRAKSATVKSALTEKLGDKLFGASHVINTEMTGKLDKFEVSDDGSVTFNDGVNSLSLDDYTSSVLDANKDLLRSTQQPGGEGGAGDQSGGGDDLIGDMRAKAGLK